jgi:uncharacterized membrane protein
MSNVRIPQGFWVAMAVAFAILCLLMILKGIVIGAIVAAAAAVWTGLEASGRGAVT